MTKKNFVLATTVLLAGIQSVNCEEVLAMGCAINDMANDCFIKNMED